MNALAGHTNTYHTYGFQEATKDVRLELEPGRQKIARNTVTLLLTETPPVQEVNVYLLDALTGLTLARRDAIPFAISI